MSSWVEANTTDGKVYYYHRDTRETSWSKPEESGVVSPPPPAPFQQPQVPQLPLQQVNHLTGPPYSPQMQQVFFPLPCALLSTKKHTKMLHCKHHTQKQGHPLPVLISCSPFPIGSSGGYHRPHWSTAPQRKSRFTRLLHRLLTCLHLDPDPGRLPDSVPG